MKTDNILIIALILLFIIGSNKIIDLNLKISEYKGERDLYKKSYIEQSEKLLTHVLINIELNNIADKYQSSRKAKKENKVINNLMDKLN